MLECCNWTQPVSSSVFNFVGWQSALIHSAVAFFLCFFYSFIYSSIHPLSFPSYAKPFGGIVSATISGWGLWTQCQKMIPVYGIMVQWHQATLCWPVVDRWWAFGASDHTLFGPWIKDPCQHHNQYPFRHTHFLMLSSFLFGGVITK